MEQSFDIFGQPEIPYIILCNPNKEEIYSLGLAFETKITKRFNALSEFRFSFPQSIDGGETILLAYEYIQNKRLVLIEGYGYFQIVDCPEDLDGSIPIKTVTAFSLESEMIPKRVTAYGGTKPLWNVLNPENTVLYDMTQLIPNWSVGTVDGSLLTKYRTFNIADTNVYNFLMNDVSKSFECVFEFNTITREINAYALDSATTPTDIFLSFDNVISKANFMEKADEITTCLSVSGGGDLDIRTVNPLGTDKIYNFDYYKNTNWMSQNLIDKINEWEHLVNLWQPNYASNLATLKTYNSQLLSLQSTLAEYNSEYLALQAVQASRIQAGLSYSDINSQLTTKANQITVQTTSVQNKKNQIANLTNTLADINNIVSFTSVFTPSELLELNNFIFENTYKNDNIIQTDSMNPVEIQDAAQALYDQGQNVLERVSQPRYEFSLESVNYIFLNEFSVFTSQTNVGSEVTIEIKDGSYISTVLLEISFTFDNPEDFTLVFSNRLRLDNGGFVYSDLMGQTVNSGNSVTFDSSAWSNWSANYKDEVTTFITSSLDASVNNLVSNGNQDIKIDQNGLRARQWTGSAYNGKQMWLVNNMLAFSTDGFSTAKLALGEITLSSGAKAYGLIGDKIEHLQINFGEIII